VEIILTRVFYRMQTLDASQQRKDSAEPPKLGSAPDPRAGDPRALAVSVVVAAGAFLLVLAIINRALFSSPIMEYGDSAANALQIERAKHLRELLGNYSRWGFHHPGPGFFYIYALGEALFHDLLHFVPAEMNAHILTIILLNAAFLFGSIWIIARRCRSPLFVPFALALSLFFIYVVNRAMPGSAFLSTWPPHVLLFCFLFFVTESAAVAVGEISQLPLLFLSGLLLVHGHAAQPLFVGTLIILVLVTLCFRQGRHLGLRRFISQNRRPVGISLLLCVVFATPIALDLLLHKPNNLDAIRFYNSQHPGIQHKPREALKYEASFLDFIPDTEVQFRSRPTHLMSLGGSKPYVAAYWCIACVMFGVLVGIYATRKTKPPLFFEYLAIAIGIVLVLFFVWTLKMAGELVSFNGYFIYGMQLLALLVLAALILDGLEMRVRPALAFALCALIPISMFAGKPEFTNISKSDAETNRLYDSIPPNIGPVHFTFPVEAWPEIIGVANHMEREGRPFCVDQGWGWVFGSENVCHEMDHLTNIVWTNLIRTPVPRKCELPCRVLLHDGMFDVQLVPYPFLKLPVAIVPDGVLTLNTDFYGASQEAVWSSKKSAVQFRLDRDFSNAPRVRVRVLGIAINAHPARIILNGHSLGSIVAGATASDFIVDRSVLLPGAENQLVIQVDHTVKGPRDPRDLGFLWAGLQLDGVN